MRSVTSNSNPSDSDLRTVVLIIGVAAAMLSLLAIKLYDSTEGTDISIENQLSRTIAASNATPGQFEVLSSGDKREWHVDGEVPIIGVASAGRRFQLGVKGDDAETIEVTVSRPESEP
jgi:hypothetical protein